LIHLYTVGEKPGADGRRIVVATKRRSLQGKPTSPMDHHEQERLGHPQKHRIHKNQDHPDPYVAAIRTAGAIPRRQKPVT
ncbi:ribosomal protein l28, partial [Lynx pardinus]